jgi:hypothetical protein
MEVRVYGRRDCYLIVARKEKKRAKGWGEMKGDKIYPSKSCPHMTYFLHLGPL